MMKHVKQIGLITLITLTMIGNLIGQDPLSEASALFEKNEFQQAFDICKPFVDIEPNNAPAVFLLGRLYFALGDLDNSRIYLDKAIELDRANMEFRDIRTQIAAFATQLTEASRLVNSADYEGAEKLYLEIIKANPNFADAYFNLAQVYVRLNDLANAAIYLRKVIAMKPEEERYARQLKNLVQQYLREGENLRQRRNNEGALEKYQQALELDPNEFLGYYLSGIAYLDIKKYDEALKSVKKGLEINPEHARSYLVLGQIYEKTNKKAEALAAYEQAVKVDPVYEAGWDRLGVLNYNQKNYEQAIAAYKKLIEINPENTRAYEKLGQIYLDMSNFKEAITNLEIVTQKDAKNLSACLRLAQAYNSQGDCAQAKTTAEAALKIKSGDALALIELGIAERCLGNKVAARQAFQLASRDPRYKRYADEHLKTVQ
ncbi:MAG: tetratricopeptide repeat protein [Candidatus Marinimicrobia bacterium]|jgi:tetratricopeptide (TPR) repeat protein|nr:tetratricopeptide repeat protein [Candidatus Neomarinimicrobiota bacterium]MCK9559557.1 tetratricopeptide repeat protein [Candidatus Neomarinimicrobiota bacterium]